MQHDATSTLESPPTKSELSQLIKQKTNGEFGRLPGGKVLPEKQNKQQMRSRYKRVSIDVIFHFC